LSQSNITTNLTNAEPGVEEHRGLRRSITLQHYNGRKEKKAEGGTAPMLHERRRDIAEYHVYRLHLTL